MGQPVYYYIDRGSGWGNLFTITWTGGRGGATCLLLHRPGVGVGQPVYYYIDRGSGWGNLFTIT